MWSQFVPPDADDIVGPDGADTVADTVAEVALDILVVLGAAAAGLVAGLIISILLSAFMSAAKRRTPQLAPFSKRARIPQRILLMIFGAGMGVVISTSPEVTGADVPWRGVFLLVFRIVLILVTAWLVHSLFRALEDSVLHNFEGAEETGHSRRVRTQMQMIRRIGVAATWVSAIVAIMMLFPAMRGFGTTFFASAGVASLVLGLAAQSSLGNLFAGIQIAFTDSVRVGDLVVAETEQGNVEELTLTYVVVRIWDNRRLVLPSSYFTTKPFLNLTRRDARLLGTVYLDVDWFTPVAALRIELQRIVEGSDLWDGVTCSLQVTDAADGKVQVRATVSAENAGKLWDLRCLVREELVHWMQDEAAYSVPRTRIEPRTTSAPPEEQRREFIEEIRREWEEQRADAVEIPRAEPVIEESPQERAERRARAAAARREAERADRRAAKKHPAILAGHESVLPLPDSAETQVLSEAELAELDRLRAVDAADGEGAPSAGTPPSGPGPELERTSVRELAGKRAESRLYSGSPDAEERQRLLSGPPPEEMAEREISAARRLENYQRKDPSLRPAAGEDDDE